MENVPSNHETDANKLARISRFFGNRAVRRVVEGGSSEVTLLPILGGFYPNDNDAILGYTQDELGKRGITTHIERDAIESGSDAMIERYKLIVDTRPEK
jgi:hypothetical protein